MKKLLTILLLLASPCFAQLAMRKDKAQQVVSGYVKPIPGASVKVCQYNPLISCITPVTIYSDPNGVNPMLNPFSADNSGAYQYFVLNGQSYVEEITAPGTTKQTYAIVPGIGNLSVSSLTDGSAVVKTTVSYTDPSWLTLNWSKILNKPTTLSGFGITDAASLNSFNAHVSATSTHGANGAIVGQGDLNSGTLPASFSSVTVGATGMDGTGVTYPDGTKQTTSATGGNAYDATARSLPVSRATLPVMINMHYGTLLGTPCLSGEPCATNNTGAPAASYTVSSSVGADGTSVTLTSVTGIQQYELLSILEADGVYRSNTAFSISGNTVTLGRPSVAGIATGTNVFEFYQNKNHPWTQGFYAIADDWVYGNALTPPRELLQSFTNLYNVQPFTLYYSTAASSVGVGPYEPATTAHPALGLTPESGGISMSLPLGSLPKGQYMVEVVAAKTGNASAVTFGVIYADGYGTSAVGIGQYDQTLHSATFTFPGRDQQVILWISTTTGTADTLIIGYINVYRITGQAAPLSTYRKIVPLGDSWYANTPGIAARLATTLPNATIVNKGVGGNTLNQMALRFWTDVAPQNPDLVITLGGTNDFYAGESAALVDFYERQIASYASSIGAASIAVNSSVGEDSGTHLELSRQYAEGVYTSRGTLPSGSTSTYCSVSGTLTSGHLIKADASSNCVDGGAALQKSDFRGYWTGMLVGGASAGATQWRNLIVKGITITRMSIAMPETGANCTVADIARLSDGTTNVDLSVPNGITTSDSGALAQNYAAGSTLTLSLVLGTCTTHSSKTNVTVEYVMQ